MNELTIEELNRLTDTSAVMKQAEEELLRGLGLRKDQLVDRDSDDDE